MDGERDFDTAWDWDVIVVGSGPAGASAALVLGRCRRRVLVVDSGEPRNARSRAVHGFLTRDGVAPTALREIGRGELRRYPSVDLRDGVARDARRRDPAPGFEVVLDGGEVLGCRKLVLATGIVDSLPEIEGVLERYGKSIFHCPYCDGWEHRDQALAVYARGEDGPDLALMMTRWSADVVLCTDGPFEADDQQRARLRRHGIGVRDDRIARVEGAGSALERIVFESGAALPRQAMFFSTSFHLRSRLAERLGARRNRSGVIETDRHEETRVPGLFVIGDADGDVQLAIIAAADGAKAALAIHKELHQEDLAAEEEGSHEPHPDERAMRSPSRWSGV